MAAYMYYPLDIAKEEIRVVDLVPSADPGAPIHLVISHVSFRIDEAPLRERRNRPSLDKLRATLPDHWGVDWTMEGRILYWTSAAPITDVKESAPFLRSLASSTWAHPFGYTVLSDSASSYPANHGDDPRFEALSYTWGDPGSLRTACVITDNDDVHASDRSDCANHQTLELAEHLANALRHLRYPDHRRRRMWIDAICINQQDDAERNDQVLRMKHIYCLAERVVVWLGPSTAASSQAMSALGYIGSQVEITTNLGCVPSPDCEGRHCTVRPIQQLHFTTTESGELLQTYYKVLGSAGYGPYKKSNRQTQRPSCNADRIRWRGTDFERHAIVLGAITTSGVSLNRLTTGSAALEGFA
ncbi:heterokaryon incompatibility protein-domain-containing protein [Apodospora peruviana]|uniref:Heterokaryon incompatibility protein-domain-containing protein n=1 Tax=Apodospora peruviana TaxID=516989 RepID=A0AAE0M2G9_9PEZI|nr:heterokaryon incompatibility protein-domain-containing protein [Apodospora peruviana]